MLLNVNGINFISRLASALIEFLTFLISFYYVPQAVNCREFIEVMKR